MSCSVGYMLAFRVTHNLNLSLGGTLRFLNLSFHPLKFYRKPLPFLHKRAYSLLQFAMLLYGGDNPLTMPIMLFIGKQALDFSKLYLKLRKLNLNFSYSFSSGGTLPVILIQQFPLD